MAKTFIPKGTTERHDNFTADTLVVNGRLIVKGTVHAARICGKGVIEAGNIRATSIVADTLDAERITARTVAADKIICAYANVSRGIIARDCIEAVEIKTGRLSSAITNADRVFAKEIIEIRPKSGFLWIILTSWFAGFFMQWRQNRIAAKSSKATAAKAPTVISPRETEFNSVVTAYREKYLTGKYRLVLESVDITGGGKKEAA